MKQAENFVSESEAATLTGLSVSTLKSFSEAGYLQVETDSDGLRLYSSSELERLFGAPVNNDELDDPFAPMKPEGEIRLENVVEMPGLAQRLEQMPEPEIIVPARPTVAPETEAPANPAPSATVRESPRSATEQKPVQAQTAEASNLRRALELQEKILEAKDREINDLREERAWLRERIEKLEDKGHRDQVLLLSETQAIRELVKHGSQPRSMIRGMMEFFGLLPPPPTVNEHKA